MNIAQYFPTTPAAIRQFLKGSQHSPRLQAFLTPQFEQWAAPIVQRLGCVPGLSAGESVLFRLVQANAPGVPHEVFERVAQATGGLALGSAAELQKSAQAVRVAVETDAMEILDRAMTERNIDPVEVAETAGLLQPTEAPPPVEEKPPEFESRREALEWHLERAQSKPPDPGAPIPPPKSRSSKPAYMDSERRYALAASWAEKNGESLDGIDAPPKVRAEVIRAPVETLRKRAGQGESWRDHLERAWDRKQAETEGPEALAAFEAGAQTAAAEADDLEAAASAEERSEE